MKLILPTNNLILLIAPILLSFICHGSAAPTRDSTCGPDIEDWDKSCCEREQGLMQAGIKKVEAKGFLVDGAGSYVFSQDDKQCVFEEGEAYVGEYSTPKFNKNQCNSNPKFCEWTEEEECECRQYSIVREKHIRGITYTILRESPQELRPSDDR